MLQTKPFLHSFLTKLFAICGGAFFTLAFIFSYQNVSRNYESQAWFLLNIFILAFMVAIIFIITTRYFSTRVFLILLILSGVGARLWWILYIPTAPHSDFYVMYEGAKQAAEGNYSFTTTGYFTRWPYQIGFTLYEALLIKIFGANLIVLKLFNIIFGMGISILIYLISKKVFNETTGRIAALLYTFYIPNIIYSSVLTNQYISTFLFLLGLYFLLGRELSGKYSWILVGLLIGLGNVFRPAGVLFILGIVVFVLLFKVYPFRKKESLSFVKKLIGIVVTYILVQQFVSMSIIYSGVSDLGLSSQDPYWKFVVGLNDETVGRYSRADDQFVSQFPLGEERKNAELELIKERIEDKSNLVSLLYKKFKLFWGGTDASIYWSLEGLEHPELNYYLTKFEQLSYLVLMFFGVGTLFLLDRKNTLASLFVILLGGYVVIHSLVEIQTRYRFDILPIIFILVGFGIHSIVQPFAKKIHKDTF